LPEGERRFSLITPWSEQTWSDYLQMMLYNPVKIYFIWFVIYALINFVIAAESVKKHNFDSTYKYFKRKSWVQKLMNKIGPNIGPAIFLAFHFTYFLITLLYGIIQFHCHWFNLLCILWLLATSTWNGACFYMEYFCKQYEV
jgi:hypothetical protein